MIGPRYQGPVSDAKHRRPPQKTEWLVDDAFHAHLESLFKSGEFSTNAQLAKHVSKILGYVVDPSTISNLRRRKHPTSRVVGPICAAFGWPHPRVASVDEEQAEPVSHLLEVLMSGGPRSRELEDMLRAEVDASRRRSALERSRGGSR